MLEYLSNTELYYSSSVIDEDKNITLTGDEFHHIVKVMRNACGDLINITNGKGTIYLCKIESVYKETLTAKVIENKKFINKLNNITFCIPVLKNPDRFKFLLEKCTELGITNYIIFDSQRSVSKVRNIEKWKKTMLAAMKQSLRPFLPVIETVNEIDDIIKLKGDKFVFDQNAKLRFDRNCSIEGTCYFVFGPEGGLTEQELSGFEKVYSLSENRLRTETAVIKCASLIT